MLELDDDSSQHPISIVNEEKQAPPEGNSPLNVERRFFSLYAKTMTPKPGLKWKPTCWIARRSDMTPREGGNIIFSLFLCVFLRIST